MSCMQDTFGLEYDLDLFNIVAVDDFNMGAMENKSLNIFNSRLVLASPETATDMDFARIEGVVGHEYFHNWTGDRVTCRDWFQLTLKEGLTVFRDQVSPPWHAQTATSPWSHFAEFTMVSQRCTSRHWERVVYTHSKCCSGDGRRRWAAVQPVCSDKQVSQASTTHAEPDMVEQGHRAYRSLHGCTHSIFRFCMKFLLVPSCAALPIAWPHCTLLSCGARSAALGSC